MSGYAIRRLLLIPPTLVLVMLMVFSMVALLPGDAVDAAGGRGLSSGSPEAREAKRAALGLDRPLPVQAIAWLVGWPRTEGVVLQTLDAGVTWAPVDESATHFFNDMTFPSGRRGVAVDKAGSIYVTLDNGVSWLKKLADNEKGLNAIAFGGPTDGIAAGNDGALFLTTNSGEEWKPIASGTGATLRDVAFSGQAGFIVGDGGTLLATTDGGRTWAARPSGTTNNLRGVAMPDATTVIIVGDGGTVMRSADAGAAWAASTTPVTTALTAIDMSKTNLMRGWLVGEAGVILSTVDGGVSWQKQNSGSETNLSDVSFGTEETGVASGLSGLVLRTTDGGSTWTPQDVNPLRRITTNLTTVTFVAEQTGFAAGWQSNWKWGLAGGNLGTSLLTSRTAAQELGARIPRSLQLMVMAMILAVGFGVPIGVLAAIRQDTWIDYLARTLAVFGLSIPGFWFATLIILLPAVWFAWTPPLEWVSFWDDPVGNLQFFALPSIVVGFGTMAAIVRMTRATMLETMRQDYIRTAWSKGLRESSVVIHHALKNAMIPVITIIGIQIPFILGETVVIEYIFRSPGIGLLAWDSVTRRDYPMLQAVVLFLAFMYISMNLVVDLTYGWLDPRIRYA